MDNVVTKMTQNGDGGRIESKVSLRIMGNSVNPKEISDLLKIQPSYTHRKGDRNILFSGRRIGDRTENIWSLESEVDSFSCVEEHLSSLVGLLKNKNEELQILRKNGLRMDLFVGIFCEEEQFGFSMGQDLVSNLASLGLGVEFDIYLNLKPHTL